jgi:hypothetical protein
LKEDLENEMKILQVGHHEEKQYLMKENQKLNDDMQALRVSVDCMRIINTSNQCASS